MENTKYAELKERLKGVLKTAKRIGLNVQSNGGYSMGYDINNLPPYPVGLFGALSIVEGHGARCRLGLTFDETESLEAGFNGCFLEQKNKKKKKRRNFKPDTELMKIGVELALTLHKPLRRLNHYPGNSDNGPEIVFLPVGQDASMPAPMPVATTPAPVSPVGGQLNFGGNAGWQYSNTGATTTSTTAIFPVGGIYTSGTAGQDMPVFNDEEE